MKRCQHCGEELPLEAAFCFKCGKQQAVKENKQTKESAEKKYFNEDHDKQARLLADMGFLPSSFQPKKKKMKSRTNKEQQQLNLDGNKDTENKSDNNLNIKSPKETKIHKPIEKIQKNDEEINKSSFIKESEKQIVPTENEVQIKEIVESKDTSEKVEINHEELVVEEPSHKPLDSVDISKERQKILDELDEQFGTPSDNENESIIVQEEPIVVVEESSPIQIEEKDIVYADSSQEKETAKNKPIPKDEQTSNRDIILSKLKSRRARHSEYADEEEPEESFENIEYVDNSTNSLLDDSVLNADEKAERKKETTSLLEKLLKKSSTPKEDLEDQNEGRKNKRRTRQTNASQLYDMEFDRTHIENDKDPEYDGYYESILPEDFGTKEKKSFDKSIPLKVGAIIGVAVIAIYLMITFMF